MIRRSIFRDVFGNNSTMKFLDFLIDNKGIDLSKKEIIEGAGISNATLFNYWQEIEEQQIVMINSEFEKAFIGKHGTSQVDKLTEEGIYRGV